MLFFICSIITVPVVAASSVGAYNITVNHDYVKVTAVCSCGLTNYTYHTSAFKNYCPHCDSYGTLVFNPKGVPEGEWTCTKCSSDYCAADGKEKMPNSPYCLISYNPPEVKAQEMTRTKVSVVVNNLDKYKDKIFLD